MTENPLKVKFSGGMQHTSHSIELKEDGTLVAELYDYSDMAEQSVGGDIAWVTIVQKEVIPQVVSSLLQDVVFQSIIVKQAENADDQIENLLPLLPLRFNRYYDFKDWLQVNEIPFTEIADTWA